MDPEDFTPAMRHGVAPIMNANVKKHFLGCRMLEQIYQRTKKWWAVWKDMR